MGVLDYQELSKQIRRQTTGFIAKHLNKRISLPISIFLVKHTKIKPNTITYFNMLIGFSTGPLAALGTSTGFLWAAVLLQTASILDGVDGEVAKFRQMSSRFGAWLDTISDNGTFVCYLLGNVVGLYHAYPDKPILMMGGLGFGSFVMIVITIVTFLRRETDSGSFVTYEKAFLGRMNTNDFPIMTRLVAFLRYLLKKDFISFLFLGVVVLGHPLWVLYICSGGGLIACVIIGYINISRAFKERSGIIPAQTTEP